MNQTYCILTSYKSTARRRGQMPDLLLPYQCPHLYANTFWEWLQIVLIELESSISRYGIYVDWWMPLKNRPIMSKWGSIFIGLSSHFFHRKKWVAHFSILHYNLLLNNIKYWYICPVVLQNSTIQVLQPISYHLMLPEFYPEEQVSSATTVSYKKGLWVVYGSP